MATRNSLLNSPVVVKVVEIPFFPTGFAHPRWLFRISEPSTFRITPHCNPLVIKRLSLHKLCWRAWCSCWNDNTTGAFGTCKRDAASPSDFLWRIIYVGFFQTRNPWNWKQTHLKIGLSNPKKRKFQRLPTPNHHWDSSWSNHFRVAEILVGYPWDLFITPNLSISANQLGWGFLPRLSFVGLS